MSHKTSILVMRISAAIFLLLLGTTIWTEIPVFAGIGFVIFLGGAIQTLIYHRCPKCEKFISPFFHVKIKFCPYCGEKIDNE